MCRALVCKTVAGFLPPAAGIVRTVLPAMCMWVGCVSVWCALQVRMLVNGVRVVWMWYAHEALAAQSVLGVYMYVLC